MDNDKVNDFLSEDTSVRHDIIQTAINFLENKNVVNTPLAQKQKFLQRKGLSEKEIQIACEKSGAYALHESQNAQQQYIPPRSTNANNSALQFRYHPQNSLFQQIKDVFHTTAVFSFVIYAAYKFYERYIKPLLFGKKKSIEDSVSDLEKQLTTSVTQLSEDVNTVKTEVERMSQINDNATQRLLQNLQAEVATVKGLLLSRKQFPSTVTGNPVVPPSIPAWQLSSVAGGEPDSDPKSEDLLEVGSGSGSEPDNRTKTSDSSLEIM